MSEALIFIMAALAGLNLMLAVEGQIGTATAFNAGVALFASLMTIQFIVENFA